MWGNYSFDARVATAYRRAMARGLWRNTYAATDVEEYWAEATQSWFNCNMHRTVPDGIHGEVSTRDRLKTYDPEISALLREFFGDTPLRYSCPLV